MLSEQAQTIFRKYLRKDHRGELAEDIRTSFARVAMGIAAYDYDPPEFYPQLLDVMLNLQFVPNRPAWYGIGRNYGFTSACTFLEMEDSLINGDQAIMRTLFNAVAIQQAGGGVGWDVSRVRPAGSIVQSTGGKATGPLGFIQGFSPVLKTVEQGGYLMGANNVGLRVDYPDRDEVLRFIRAKMGEFELTQFNTNLVVTDAFMRDPDPEIWEALIDAMWTNGGIGVQFIDTANKHNAIPGFGELKGTNPCSEFWLFHGESCQPGYVNMNQILREDKTIDWEHLAHIMHVATRAMDNLIDANRYIPAVPILEKMAKATRRMGIGPTGFADLLVKMGIRYGSREALELVGQVMEFMLYIAMRTSINLARERGPFPLFDKSIYKSGQWQPPKPLHYASQHEFGRPTLDWQSVTRAVPGGVRNCGFTVIAPSSFGSQTMMTEGYGIEPIFAPTYQRNYGDGSQDETVTELASYPAFVAAHEVQPLAHVQMVAAAQRFVTESISKTVNMPYEATREAVANVVQTAWSLGCKNITVYRAQSRTEEALVPCTECQVMPEDADD